MLLAETLVNGEGRQESEYGSEWKVTEMCGRIKESVFNSPWEARKASHIRHRVSR